MKRTFLSLLLYSAALPFCMAQTALTEYHPGVTTEGAVYFLPKTAINVRVTMEKVTYTPGDFCNYAMRYLRLNDVEQEPSTTYRILKIKQEPVAIADTAKAYAIKFDPKTVAPNVALSDDGRLLAINAQPKEQTEAPLFEPAPKPRKINPRQFMSEEILSSGSTAKMAELTAREIYDLRENRNLLIKGQADFMPNDGAQMKMMLDRLETQDKVLSQLFTGTTERDTTETIYTIIPDGDIQKQVLFRLSQQRGLVDHDDLSGVPYYFTVEDLKTVPPINEEEAAKAKKKKYEAGVYVNVAGRMRSTIFRGENVLSKAEMPAAQFGHVELLSGELFNKRYTTHLWLNVLTGAVEMLEAEQPK